MKRIALLAVGLFLAIAGPAGAQGSVGTPVVGGGSFNTAPILGPGTYRDTILPAEYLYYGFKLEAGQQLHIKASTDIDHSEVNAMGVLYVSVNIHTPTRVTDVNSNQPGDNKSALQTGGDNYQLAISSEVVRPDQDAGSTGTWPGAGVYYLAVHTAYTGDRFPPPRSEIPFTFTATIDGQAKPSTTDTPTPTPTAKATPAAPPRATASDGPPAALAAGFGVGGILIGVVAGIARGRRRR
ncbi:MAG: Ca-activated chloride channel [Thermoleophilaceae bacterium]|nr:Ca-activated chloride channel [Thermoleophilaceae bacterium]